MKVVMLRTYLALLAAAQKAYDADGGRKNPENAADAYMTLLGYFNSLRELGGARRIVEDEVNLRLTGYANRKRLGQKEGPFASRSIAYEVVELTSRVHTGLVAEAKRPACPAVSREGPCRCRDRDQHDFRRTRHHAPRPDGRPRAAQDVCRVHPGHQPRRT